MDIQIFIDQFLNNIQQQFNIPAKIEWNKEEEVFFCLYTFKIGHKKGTMCAKKLKNGEYCSAHKPKIVHVKQEPIIIPKTNIARYHKKIEKYEYLVLLHIIILYINRKKAIKNNHSNQEQSFKSRTK